MAMAGCFSVKSEFGDCAVRCTRECPDGYACRNGWCAAEASEATCTESAAPECADGACGFGVTAVPAPLTPMPLPPVAVCEPACPRGCECVDAACYLDDSRLPCVAAQPPAVQVTPSVLRAACSGLAYDADLVAQGGESPYSWQLDSDTALRLDAATGHLSGVLQGPGRRSLSVSVRDASGNTTQTSLSLDVREQCWIAYLSRETGSARLHVVDQRLTERRVFPPLSEAAAEVLDFKFSPDGRYLAFRQRAPAGETVLHLAPTGTATETVLPFARPVLDYAWSGDGRSIAVVLASDQLDSQLLSGIDIDPLGQVWNEQATSYRDSLQWAGNSALVYQGQARIELPDLAPISIPDKESPYVAVVRPGSIDTPREILEIQLEQSRLYAFPGGFMSRSLEFAQINGFRMGEAGSQDISVNFGYPSMAWSETHQHVLSLDEQRRFEIYSILDSSAALAISASPCPELLAWRSLKDRERAVCLDTSLTGCPASMGLSGVLRLFDFFPLSNQLEEHLIPGCYPAAGAQGNPRMLSQQGRWFVFDVNSVFAIAGFADASLRTFNLPADGDQRAYEVAPDEQRALLQIGEDLLLQTLDPPGDALPVTSPERPALPPEPCTAVFADESDGWCGAGNLRHARWAPDSLSVVYQARDGALWLADVSVPDQLPFVQQLSATATCPNGCVSSYAFQPAR